MKNKGEKDNKKKKERHPIRNTCLVLIILALLGGGGFGAWRYGGFEWGYQEEKETTAQVETTEQNTEETTAETETWVEDVISLIVSGDTVVIRDKSFTESKEIKDYVMSIYQDGYDVELVDNKALKKTYDIAKSVLDDLGYSYTERNK